MQKNEVAQMLRQYDAMRAELRTLERALGKACTDYGRSKGIWGFTRDHLRLELEREDMVA